MKSALPVKLITLLLLLPGARSVGAQDQESYEPSPGEVTISGVSPTRFNPTHGTAFFRVSGAYFPSDPRDVAVIVGERQLSAGSLAVTRRIAAASYVMPPGPNSLTLRAWDAGGQVLTTTTRIWAGDLTLSVQVTDAMGNPADGGEVVASLTAAPSVRTVVPVVDGRAELSNLPDAEIRLEATHPGGLSATTTVRAAYRRAELVLR